MSTRGRWSLLLSLLLVAAAVTAVAAVGIAGRSTYGNRTSGDEPHYLLTALSLGEDGDLDVADEQRSERYRPFHEQTIASQAAVRDDGSMVVPHDPLLPVLLALPMRWGGVVAAKATLALLAGALAALTAWTAVRRFGVPVRTAALTASLAGASVPLAGYGHQVYPEIPAALAVVVAVAALTGRGGWGATTAVGIAVVALPWSSVKYVPVAAALALLALAPLATTIGRGRAAEGARTRAAVLTAILLVAAVTYVLAHLAWYGGLTAYAAGDFFRENGPQLSVVGTDPNYLARSRRLIGLLVARDFGIATWQPLWWLAVPAIAALCRRRPSGALTLGAPLAAGWLTATFLALTMHGWWFPGRQVVVVLPLAVLAIAWWAGDRPARLAAIALLGLVGVVNYLWLTADAAAGRVTWIVDFAATGAPLYRALRVLAPDYLRVSAATWALQALWLAVAGALAWWGWRAAHPPTGTSSRTDTSSRRRGEPSAGPGPLEDADPTLATSPREREEVAPVPDER